MKKMKLLQKMFCAFLCILLSPVYGQADLKMSNSISLYGTNIFEQLQKTNDSITYSKSLDEPFSPSNIKDPLPKKFELAAWYGLTFAENEDQNGVRRLDVKYEPNKQNLLFLFYDNALVLDNNTVATLERSAPIVGVGIKHDWSKKWFSKLETGIRFLSTSGDQYLFHVENGYFFSDRYLGKLITQYDIRPDDNLLTLGGFVDFKVLKNLRIETGLFHAENLTFSETFNERFMLVPKLQLGRTELIIGAYYDRYRTPDVSLDQFSGGYGLFVFSLLENLKGNLFFNYDKGFRNEIMVISLGVNQKI